MSDSPILLPNGAFIAGENDLDGHFVQQTSDLDLLAAIQHLTSRTDLVTAAVNSVTEKLTADPVTGADMDAVVAAINVATAKLSDDPATGEQVSELADVIADILAKLPDDPATESDLADVVIAVNAVTAKIPSGAATDAHVDLATAAINAVAAKLPTDAATGTAIAAVTAAVNAVTAKLPAAPALDSTLQQIRDRLSIPDQVVTGTLTAVNQVVDIPVRLGDQIVSLVAGGTYVAVWSVLAVINGIEVGISLPRTDPGSAPISSAGSSIPLQGMIPAGATTIRIKCIGFTSGSVAVTLATSSRSAVQNTVGVTGGTINLATVTHAGSDGNNTSTVGGTNGYLYNGTNWARQRSNTIVTSIGTAARTVATTAPDLETYNARGVRLVLNVTAASGTGGLGIRLEGKTAVTYYLIGASAQVATAVGVYTMTVYPGMSGGSTALNSPIAKTLRPGVSHADTSSYTYSLEAELLL